MYEREAQMRKRLEELVRAHSYWLAHGTSYQAYNNIFQETGPILCKWEHRWQ